MVCGYVLVSVEPTRELEIYGKLLKLKGIQEVCPVLGAIDFIVKVKLETQEELANLVIWHIRKIQGIINTNTFIEDEFMKNLQELAD